MSLYLAERYLRGSPVSRFWPRRARDTAVRMTEEGTAVRYLGSTFIPEDEACFCLFDAASDRDGEGGQRAGSDPIRPDHRGCARGLRRPELAR